MSGREIVTLQFGHYANFTGTQLWNLQEASFVYDPKHLQVFPKEVNHDILFREGQTLKGDVTFTPRLVLLDLKGSLNTLPKGGVLYQEGKEEDVKWSGDVTLHKSVPSHKNDYLQHLDSEEQEDEQRSENSSSMSLHDTEDTEDAKNSGKLVENSDEVFGHKFFDLDDQVKVWSDFLGTHLHPRSVQLMQNYILDCEEQPFDVFGLGKGAMSGDLWDEWEDRVHFFVEECDQLQGFHVLFDSCNGFGGAAAAALHYLKDEFPSKSLLTLSLVPAITPDQTALQRATRIINNTLSLGTCAPLSSMYIPLSLSSSLWRNLGAPRSFPFLRYKAELNYHTSAVLASAFDTMTLPYRTESGQINMADLTASFSFCGRKVAALNTSLPFPLAESETFADTLINYGKHSLWHALTPSVTCQVDPAVHSCVVRGIPSDKIHRENQHTAPRLISTCGSVDDVLQLFLSETFPNSLNEGSVLRDPLIVKTPFPHIFDPRVTQTGFVSDTQRHPKCGVESVPMMTSLQSGSDVGNYVSSLHMEAARFHIKKLHHFLEAGLEEEEYLETLQSVHELADCYNIAHGND